MTTVINAGCNTSTVDQFGRVSDGFVSLHGTLHDGRIKLDGTSNTQYMDFDPGIHSNFRNAFFIADGPLKVVKNVFSVSKERTLQRSRGKKWLPSYWAPVKYLLMQRRILVSRAKDEYDTIVLDLSQRKQNCYERLGYVYDFGGFKTWSQSPDDSWIAKDEDQVVVTII